MKRLLGSMAFCSDRILTIFPASPLKAVAHADSTAFMVKLIAAQRSNWYGGFRPSTTAADQVDLPELVPRQKGKHHASSVSRVNQIRHPNLLPPYLQTDCYIFTSPWHKKGVLAEVKAKGLQHPDPGPYFAGLICHRGPLNKSLRKPARAALRTCKIVVRIYA